MAAIRCTFCAIVAGEVPAQIVVSTPEVIGFLDARPVFKGHTLLVPRQHIGTLPEVTPELLASLMHETQRLATAVVDGLGSQGSFVAINNVVSQSVPHLHVHVVPRTKGDGLRGFFWPRTKYDDEADALWHRDRLRDALEG